MLIRTTPMELDSLSMQLAMAKELFKIHLTNHEAHRLYSELAYDFAKKGYVDMSSLETGKTLRDYISNYVTVDMLAAMPLKCNVGKCDNLANYVSETFTLSTSKYGDLLAEQQIIFKHAIDNETPTCTVLFPLLSLIQGFQKT